MNHTNNEIVDATINIMCTLTQVDQINSSYHQNITAYRTGACSNMTSLYPDLQLECNDVATNNRQSLVQFCFGQILGAYNRFASEDVNATKSFIKTAQGRLLMELGPL